MRVLFVSSEVHPFAKTGGLADVSAALPAALRELGHDVITVTPAHSSIDRERHGLERMARFQDVELSFGPHRGTWDGWKHDVSRTIFVDIPELYDRDEIYTHGDDEPVRWAALAHATLDLPGLLGWQPHVIHCNDWQTGLIPLLLETRRGDPLLEKAKTVMTIHNLGYQGRFGSTSVGSLGLGEMTGLLHREHLTDGYVGFLETGLMYADAITTVSPTYAREIQTPEGGAGLDELLSSRSDAVFGILNGVDTDEWDPATDPFIPAHYSASDRSGKTIDRDALLDEFDLDPTPGPPVVGVVSRLAYQKGIELMDAPLRHFLSTWDLRVVVLGSGEPRYEAMFDRLTGDFPDRVGFRTGYDNQVAHLIEAGSDIFLMPSLYEPCGLNQMYSLIYGTLPVVRRVGGLADTVVDIDEPDGNGFVFEHYTPEGLGWALGRALDVHTRPDHWDPIVGRAMAGEFSWTRRAGEYVDVYESLTR